MQARLTPISGPHHRVNVRVQGAQRSYAVGLAENRRLVLYKKAGAYVELASVPFVWRHQESYQLTIGVKGNRLRAEVDGGQAIETIDRQNPYLRGQIGFSTAGGSHTRFCWLEVIGDD